MRPGIFFRVLLFAGISVSFSPGAALAGEGTGALHWSGDKTLYDSRNNRMELIGHAAIHQNGESLFADKITFERDTKLVHATGNAVYVGKTALLQGSEMHFNLETRTGTIIGGRVSTNQFTLSGERINKLGAGRFQAHRADYSTCKDCPQSWTLSAADVDLEIDGYAYLSNVTAKVGDAPAFWIPYLIVPIKKNRQSGLLVPQFGFGTYGFRFVEPFFWAINRSVDLTIGLGNYGGQGKRVEGEARYALLHGSGIAKYYHLDDRKFRDYLSGLQFTSNPDSFSSTRWGLHVEQKQELPWDIQEKLRIVDVGDAGYRTDFPADDVPGDSQAYLFSDFSLTHATDKVSAFVFARRYRNILTPIGVDPRIFDPKTVQVFPQVEVTSNDKSFFDGKVVGGLSLGATNFVRSANFFDRDIFDSTPLAPGAPFRPGQDPIREALRTKLNPSVYTTLRPADTVAIVPKFDYSQYFYNFGNKVPALSRGYLHFTTDVSMQFERVYDRDPNSDTPKMKHLIRPLLSYSAIPIRSSPRHPFTDQITYAQQNGFTGYNFDNQDIVPIDSTLNNANYFAPEGNAVSYGFTTQIVRKRKTVGAPEALTKYTYDQPLEWSAGQSFNLRELRKNPTEQRPLSRFYSLITANFDKANAYVDYYYIPYQNITPSTSRHVYSVATNYVNSHGTGKVLAYERTLGASYTFNRSNLQSQTQVISLNAVWSLNDYIMPGASVGYNILGGRWASATTSLTFQSPSECWKLDLALNQAPCTYNLTADRTWCYDFRFNLSLNLTGSGYGNMSDPKAVAASK